MEEEEEQKKAKFVNYEEGESAIQNEENKEETEEKEQPPSEDKDPFANEPEIKMNLKLFKYANELMKSFALTPDPSWPIRFPMPKKDNNSLGEEYFKVRMPLAFAKDQTAVGDEEHTEYVEQKLELLDRFICSACDNLLFEPYTFKTCQHACCKSCLDRVEKYVWI